jgi:hypothetical protein
MIGEPAGTRFLWRGKFLQPLPGEFRLETIERIERSERDRRAAAEDTEADGRPNSEEDS